MELDVLTEKQKEVFKFIEKYQLENAKSPTFNEIKEYFNLKSLNAVFKHINALTKKNYIEKDNKARGICLLPKIKEQLFSSSKTNDLPLYGEVPAGNPLTAEGNMVDKINLIDLLVKSPDDTFLLKVKGDSVDKSGILDGDIVIVDSKKEPSTYDIIVALVDYQNTLKQYTRDKLGHVHLVPFSTNPNHKEIIPINEAYIQGVVIGSVRKY